MEIHNDAYLQGNVVLDATLAVNGLHIGGSTDPGLGNLIVDGTSTLSGRVGIGGNPLTAMLTVYGDEVVQGSLEVGGQITSTVGAGTPPLVVTSPTLVTNLNSDMVDGLHAQTLTASTPLTLSGVASVLAAAGITLSHDATSGYIHVPAGGSAGQILIYGGSAGSASWTSTPSIATSVTAPTINATVALAIGVGYALAGAIRLENATWIAARNALNSADVNIVRVNSSNQIEFGAEATTANPIVSTAGLPSLDTHLATKAYVDLATAGMELTEYFSNTGADIGGVYYYMAETAASGATVSTASVGAGSERVAFAFVTPASEPNLDRLIPGSYASQSVMYKTGTKSVDARFRLFKRSTAAAATTGTVATISFLNLSPAMISRSSGSFIADGFTVGSQITISGAAQPGNNGTKTVIYVAAGAMLLSAGDTLTDEAAGAAVTILSYETLVGTSDYEYGITTTPTAARTELHLSTETSLALTDRLVVKFFIDVGSSGTDVTFNISVGGSNNSRFAIRVLSTELDTVYIPYSGAKHDADLGSYDLAAAILTAATQVSTPSIITAAGALTITPAAGSGVNISLSTTGDFAVNSTHLVVDTSTARVGVGTAAPLYSLDVQQSAIGIVQRLLTSTAATYTGAAPNGQFLLDSKFTGESLTWNTARIKWGYAANYAAGGARFGIDVVNTGGAWINVVTISGSLYMGVGTESPTSRLEVGDGNFYLSDSDVAHGMTDYYPTNVYGVHSVVSPTAGGLLIRGLSDHADVCGVVMDGFMASNPTDTVPAVWIRGYKANGTGVAALGAAETVFQVSNASTIALTVLGSGYLGVGTVSPATPLHAYLGDDHGEILRVETNTGTSRGAISVYSTADDHILGFGSNYYLTGAGSSARHNANASAWVWFLGAATAGGSYDHAQLYHLDTAGNGAALMHVTGAGNVGIGTTAPGAKLEVAGPLNTEQIRLSYASDVGYYHSIYTGTHGSTAASNNIQFRVHSGSGAQATVMTMLGSGNVGIGTISPVSLFEVRGGLTTTGAVLTLGTNEPSVVANDILGRVNFYAPLEADGSDSVLLAASVVAIAEDTFSTTVNKTGIAFHTGVSEAATEKMRLTNGGHLCLGYTTPRDTFSPTIHIEGTIPALTLYETDGGTNAKQWEYYASGSVLYGRAVDDAISGTSTWLQVARTAGAVTIASVTFPTGTVAVTNKLTCGTFIIPTSAPSAETGAMYFSTVGSQLYIYNGGWKVVQLL